jgi:uncharacterized membrane protein
MTSALTITMTRAGQARFTAAQLGDPIDLTISSVGLTDVEFVAAPTLEALPGEFRRLDMISGQIVGDNVAHLTMRDDDAVGYTARGFGLFLSDGTLFGAYGQQTRLFEKSVQTTFLAAIDIAFPTAAIDNLTFGDTNFFNPPATTTVKGVVELATQAEADAGTDTHRVAPVSVMRATIAAMLAAVMASLQLRIDGLSASLHDLFDDFTASVGQALDGLAARTVYGSGLITGGGRNDTNRFLHLAAATATEVRAGTPDNVAVTPGGLVQAGVVFVVAQSLAGGAGYRSWSDGLKECWGSVDVPAGATVVVPLPVPHDEYCIPTGSCSIAQDEASIGALGANAGGFSVRNRNPVGTVFYWHTKGR